MSFGTQLKKIFFKNCASDSYELKCISNYWSINAGQWGMQQQQQKHSEHCWLVKLTHTRVGS